MAEHGAVDLATARSVEEFAACLRLLRAHAGTPSFRTLERWGRQHDRPLPRSTLLDALSGKRLPSKTLVLAFIEACGVDPRADPRWAITWNRLAAQQADRSLSRPDGRDPGADILGGVPRSRSQPLDADDLAVPGQLAADIRAAGLRRIGARYLSDLEWDHLFADVSELDIFVAYGQTWRNLHARALSEAARRSTSRIRVFLADPHDDLTVTVLADRFAITPAELRTRIEATSRDYADLRRQEGALVEIYYRPGDRVFSFYRFDDVVVIGFYSHTRTRTTSVPVFVCSAPGELFQFVSDELRAIEEQSRLA